MKLPSSGLPTTAHTATIPVGRGVVVIESSVVVHPPGLQRRAMRLPRISLPSSRSSGPASDAGWIWLVQYLHDPQLPPWLPQPPHSRESAHQPTNTMDDSRTDEPVSVAPHYPRAAGASLSPTGRQYKYTASLTDEELQEQVSFAENLIKKTLETVGNLHPSEFASGRGPGKRQSSPLRRQHSYGDDDVGRSSASPLYRGESEHDAGTLL